jgi:hypothetical protein
VPYPPIWRRLPLSCVADYGAQIWMFWRVAFKDLPGSMAVLRWRTACRSEWQSVNSAGRYW